MEESSTAETTEQRFLHKYATLMNVRHIRISERRKKIFAMTGDRDAHFVAPKQFEDYEVIVEEIITHKPLR